MQNLINEAIMPMVNDGVFSMERISDLVYVKEFIDRISTKNYIGKQTVEGLFNLYGVMPNIITWGDYFQTEMASSLLDLDDKEFRKAVETIRFDMISSYKIFSEKDKDFFNWVEESYLEIAAQPKEDFTDEEQETYHLHILKDYYQDIGITDKFSEAEIRWYSPFREAMVV
ncbi:MAG: hypothetical protein GY754_17570 [bacterium]|nr:hypothetical protein [bacterium]